MTSYIELLGEIRTKIESFQRTTAHKYIPELYRALRAENLGIKPLDARKRIQKDCARIWSKRTILNALPDEAKDTEKQKSGRLGQKKHNCAAVSAAQLREIVIDTKGCSITDDPNLKQIPKAGQTNHLGQISNLLPRIQAKQGQAYNELVECSNCLELLSKNKELEEAVRRLTLVTPANELDHRDVKHQQQREIECLKRQLQSINHMISNVEFAVEYIPLQKYMAEIFKSGTYKVWFNIRVGKNGVITHVYLGRNSQTHDSSQSVLAQQYA